MSVIDRLIKNAPHFGLCGRDHRNPCNCDKMTAAAELAALRERIKELEAALLSTEHLDVQSVLAFEAGKRSAWLDAADLCQKLDCLGDVSAEARRRAGE